MAEHIPAMLEEVMTFLEPEKGGPYWDLTLGAGGHLNEFATRAPASVECYGLDGDIEAIERCRHLPASLLHGNLGDLEEEVSDAGWPRPRAVLMDLGLSSPQVNDAHRGFSYRNDGPLDMRMNTTVGPTAAEWLDKIAQKELQQVIRELGEERYAGRIARVIKESLPIQTTSALAKAVLKAVGGKSSPRIHPARRTFQAIRIAVNDELGKLTAGLSHAIDALTPGGRIVVLSFHSGEDRIVKNVFRDNARAGHLKLLTKKPLKCTDSEAATNPRARSTLLRAAEKL